MFEERVGRWLAAEVADVEVADLRGSDLVEFLRASAKVVAWAQSVQLAAVAELARRRPERDASCGEAVEGSVSEFAAAEVAAALTLSRRAADRLLSTAVDLERLPASRSALAAGALDLSKVRVIAEHTANLTNEQARAVEAHVLPRAGGQTLTGLTRSLRRAVVRLAPETVADQEAAAAAEARAWLTHYGDGTSSFTLLTRSHEALRMHAAVDAVAREIDPDTGTIDQRRAEACRLIADAILDDPELLRGRTNPPGLVLLTDRFGAAARGEDDARDQAADGEATQDEAQARARDQAASDDEADGHSAGGQDDRTGGHSAGDEDDAERDEHEARPTAGAACPDGGSAPGSHHMSPDDRSADGGRESVGDDASSGESDVGHGPSRQPAELVGYGYVPDSLAQRLAADRHCVVRPQTPPPAPPCDHGRYGYVPPERLVRYVHARDKTCRFPGCYQPAEGCDLDHNVPYPTGPTCACNLGALCRYHHRLKTHGGWRLEQPVPGDFVWTSPMGHVYRRSWREDEDDGPG